MRLADRILEMDGGIRFVVLLGGDGNVLEKQVRRGVRLLVPEELFERAINQIIIVWTIAEELGKYVGQPTRIVLHHEQVDVVVVKAGSLYCGMTANKSVKSDDLSRKLIQFIEQRK